MKSYLIASYQILRNALIILLALSGGAFVLTVPDQAEDMTSAVIFSGISSPLFLAILATAFLWGWLVYGCTRLLLHISPVGIDPGPASDRLLRWIPRVSAVAPALILAFAFRTSHRSHPYWLLLEASAMLVLLICLEEKVRFFALPRQWVFPDKPLSMRQDLIRLWTYPVARLTVLTGLVLTVGLVLLFSLPVEWELARYLRPTAVVILGLTMYTFLLSTLLYFNDYRYRPFVLGVVAYLILISGFNDNTAVRKAQGEDTPALENRPTIGAHFVEWVNARFREDSTRTTIPLILVAAQGGGIRALDWTAETLIRLDSLLPGFSRHVYAVSGVSGGGVGAVFYTAFLRDFPEQNQAERQRRFPQFRSVIRADYLSGVTAALLYPELVQRVSFWPWPRLERAKWLEDSWADSYADSLGKNTLSQSLTQLYQTESGYNYSLPSLFLNGTLAESGQKAITSNLKIDSTFFRDVVPTLDVIGADVPLKTAASLCSRFPVVTNGALIRKCTVLVRGREPREYSGHVVDGGYFDNTGIETCIQILNNLVQPIRQLESLRGICIRPFIIFIQNGDTASDIPQKRSLVQVVQIPLLGFLNSWDNGSVTRDNTYRSFMDRFDKPPTTYLTIRLRHSSPPFPLGWYLSDSMAERLAQQAKATVDTTNPEIKKMTAVFKSLSIRRLPVATNKRADSLSSR